jgi:hypothetical protein
MQEDGRQSASITAMDHSSLRKPPQCHAGNSAGLTDVGIATFEVCHIIDEFK